MYVCMYVCVLTGLQNGEYWGLSESRALSNSVHHYTHALEHSTTPTPQSGGTNVTVTQLLRCLYHPKLFCIAVARIVALLLLLPLLLLPLLLLLLGVEAIQVRGQVFNVLRQNLKMFEVAVKQQLGLDLVTAYNYILLLPVGLITFCTTITTNVSYLTFDLTWPATMTTMY